MNLAHKVTRLERFHSVNVTVLNYDYLITTKKLQSLTSASSLTTKSAADEANGELKVGKIIQCERKGLYTVDKALGKPSTCGEGLKTQVELAEVPDGRAATVQLKEQPHVVQVAKAAVAATAHKVEEAVSILPSLEASVAHNLQVTGS